MDDRHQAAPHAHAPRARGGTAQRTRRSKTASSSANTAIAEKAMSSTGARCRRLGEQSASSKVRLPRLINPMARRGQMRELCGSPRVGGGEWQVAQLVDRAHELDALFTARLHASQVCHRCLPAASPRANTRACRLKCCRSSYGARLDIRVIVRRRHTRPSRLLATVHPAPRELSQLQRHEASATRSPVPRRERAARGRRERPARRECGCVRSSTS